MKGVISNKFVSKQLPVVSDPTNMPITRCYSNVINAHLALPRRKPSPVLYASRRLLGNKRRILHIVATYPEPETEKERSPIDFPQEWITPQPSRRPDIFPEFEKLETPLPKPLPGDPEAPDEEEEEEEQKKKKKDPDDPDEEGEPKPDEPAPSQE